MQKPQLVLADEPTAALDPAAAAQSCALLLQAAQQATLITVVHNTALLPLLADRVLGLRLGSVVFDLPTSHVNDTVLNQLYQTPA
jgi:phosphonate transport system ATP-binding protein